LWEANLGLANLKGADLSKVYMPRANLKGADLCDANLSGVQLESGDLTEAILLRTKLRAARLRAAKLRGANMHATDLRLADLSKADLGPSEHRRGTGSGALLSEADLSGAKLNWANLTETDLTRANLEGAALKGATLRKADLTRSNLRGADLAWADLSNAILVETILTATKFTRVTLAGALYEPASAPSKGTVSEIKGLLEVRFSAGKQNGLVMLRAAFKDVGLRRLEREATYLIERGKTGAAPPIERWFRRALFEWTSEYGMSPGRPLRILLALMLLFSLPYMLSVVGSADTPSGIWRVWREDRIEKQSGEETPERVAVTGYRVPLWGFYFSLLSAFHVGWRDLNVGNWIARINPQEYDLRATGWVKVVSGIQSLISVYLIALWALTYFGRPFQ
ncbi:MAG: pentapeptide repeat-containing protein, partial [Alphaproteobacteria bacterium]|nr:pentapeptide repeat-containing protein [Alphaproteobacteria bacterium]